jgi:hypothetical protein
MLVAVYHISSSDFDTGRMKNESARTVGWRRALLHSLLEPDEVSSGTKSRVASLSRLVGGRCQARSCSARQRLTTYLGR